MRKLLVVLAALAIACGGDGASNQIVETEPKGPPAPPPKAVSCTPAQVTTGTSAEPFGTKPSVVIPDAPPPTQMLAEDLIVGTGSAVAAGSQVQMQYVGVSWSTKEQFDASWDRGQPFPLTLGQGRVIKGWDEGIPGMKVGGRRRLTIPPSCGYGPQGQAPIKPNETLVFVVDLVSSP